MRIAFVISGQEPERDGVGDYTRQLSEECCRRGNPCCRVSLNDRFVSEPKHLANENIDCGVPELRLPRELSWTERMRLAAQFIAKFEADVISLQYVPYGYHSKGLPFGFAQRLQTVIAGRPLHLMVHEMWIAMLAEPSFKRRAIGVVQRSIIANMLKRLKPCVIHTTTSDYQHAIARLGWPSKRLGLFGNIPIVQPLETDWIYKRLQNDGTLSVDEPRDSLWIAGFFGAIPSTYQHAPLLQTLSKVAELHAKKVVMTYVCAGKGGEKQWEAMCSSGLSNFTFSKVGRLPADEVSKYLSSLDFGVSSTPIELAQKSSTVASMLEHGLPVLIDQWNADDPRLETGCEPLLWPLAEFSRRVSEPETRKPPRSRLGDVAHQMVCDIELAIS